MPRFLLSVILILAPLCNMRAQVRIPGPGGAVTGGSDTAFLTTAANGSLRNNLDGCVGFTFTVGGANITATSLGRQVVSGNSASHIVRLYDYVSGASLGNVTIATSGASVGYKYATLGSPITLTAATQYTILSEETNGGDQWYDQDGAYTPTGVGTISFSSYVVGACTSATGQGIGSASNVYVPVNFLYH